MTSHELLDLTLKTMIFCSMSIKVLRQMQIFSPASSLDHININNSFNVIFHFFTGFNGTSGKRLFNFFCRNRCYRLDRSV